jgi:hypothetical protein
MKIKFYRFSPKTYFDLIQMDCREEKFLQPQSERNETLVLGGKYNIIKQSGILNRVCKLEPGNFFVARKNLIQDSDFPFFREKDLVVYQPVCSEAEKKYLAIINSCFIPGKRYKIYRVINKLYYLLKNDTNEISIPIRYVDLRF